MKIYNLFWIQDKYYKKSLQSAIKITKCNEIIYFWKLFIFPSQKELIIDLCCNLA